ncbi:MAG: DNA-protecting protein DprA [Patescibacteria group bacterium]|nr:DNA-protecting protein DprA [Patescibacteria group bacterium]
MRTIKRNDFTSHPLLTRLQELHKQPEELYIVGNLPKITLDEYGRATPRILTIVGSRNHTTYAEDVVRTLVESLKGKPVVIVSGLALGIDSLAHKHAIKNTIPTIAIPGSGLDKRVLYPRTNVSLAETIVQSGGALISELDTLSKAAKWTFPSRNRIMAALSDVVLIIEAQEKSGTLVTARQALELGRDIGVIPGNIFSKNSEGTNELARQGAHVITSPRDLFDLLHLSDKDLEEHVTLDLTLEEKKIIDALTQPLSKDALLTKTKLTPTDFLITLSSLEMKGYVQETFGEVRKVV